MDSDKGNFWDEDSQYIHDLVDKFEDMLKNNHLSYFDIDDLNCLIEYYIDNDDVKKVNLIADFAIDMHSNDPIIQLIKAKKCYANNDVKGALKLLNDPFLDKDNADYLITLGACYSDLGNNEKAISAYKKALPYFEPEERYEVQILIACEYHSIGNKEKTLSYYLQAVKNNPYPEEQYFDIRNCYLELGKETEAIEFFKDQIDKNPYSIEAWCALALCHSQRREFDEMNDCFEYALAIDSHCTDIYSDMAVTYNFNSLYDKTIDIVKEAIDNDIETPQLYCLMGEAQSKLNLDDDALASFEKACDTDPSFTAAYAGKGFTLIKIGNLKQALPYLKKAHELEPNNTIFLFTIIDLLIQLNDTQKVKSYLTKAEKIAPNNDIIFAILMELHLNNEEYDESYEAVSRGLVSNPESGLLHYRMAVLYLIKSEDYLAMIYLEKALQLDIEGHANFLEFLENIRMDNKQMIYDLIEEYRIINNKQNNDESIS